MLFGRELAATQRLRQENRMRRAGVIARSSHPAAILRQHENGTKQQQLDQRHRTSVKRKTRVSRRGRAASIWLTFATEG